MRACLASSRMQWRFYTCSRIVLNIAMPSHQDYCLRVCAVCWRKDQRKAYPTEEALIEEFVISNYTTDQPTVKFPWPRPLTGCAYYPCGLAIVVVKVCRTDIDRYAVSGNANSAFFLRTHHSIPSELPL